MMQLAGNSTHLSDLFNNSYILAVFSAVCGFIFAWIMARIQARSAPRKAISWDVSIEKPPQLDKDQERRVGMTYRGVEVKDLVQVYILLENTGNTVIKNEYVRFRLPEQSRILEVETDPTPEPELDVSEVRDGTLGMMDRRYKIGHLEVGQSVRFYIATDGGAWSGWSGMHPFNEEGGVLFQRRDIARAKEDVEEVRPFIRNVAALFVVALLALVFPYPESMAFAIVSIPLCVYVIIAAPRVSRVVQRLISGRAGAGYEVSMGNLSGGAMVGDYNTLHNYYGTSEESEEGGQQEEGGSGASANGESGA